MRLPFATVAVLGTAAAVFSLAGCGSSTSPSPTNFKSLSQADQQTFKSVAVNEIEASVLSFTTVNPSGLFFFDRVASKRFTGGLRMVGSKITPRFQSSSSCYASSGNTNDEDADGVVDADSLTYSCHDTASGQTITENGFWTWGDPTPNTADLEITDAANLSFAVTGSQDGNISLGLKGNSSITQSSTALTLQGQWALNATIANSPSGDNGTFNLGANETATYTWSGTVPTYFGQLTAGTISLSGNWNYDINATKETVNLSFSVSTPTVLTIDRNACTANPEGIQSGVVQIKFADGTLVTAKWDGCPATPSTSVT